MELLQVDGIGAARLKRFSEAGVRTIRRLASLEFYHIERLMSRNPPFGQTMLRQLAGFPLLTIEVEDLGRDKRPEVGDTGLWMLRLTMGYENKQMPVWKDQTPWLSCVVENAANGEDRGKLMWFWRGSVKRLDGGVKEMIVGVAGYQGCKLRVTLACEVLVGTMVQKDVVL